MFRELGAEVLDADADARQAVGRPAWRELRRLFGPECFQPDGELNRARVARLVFSDPQGPPASQRHRPPQGGPEA
jgi:dephospho-CoA kinase